MNDTVTPEGIWRFILTVDPPAITDGSLRGTEIPAPRPAQVGRSVPARNVFECRIRKMLCPPYSFVAPAAGQWTDSADIPMDL